MKSVIIVVALAASVYGDVSHLGYAYHAHQTMTSYLPPIAKIESIFMPSNMYLPTAPKKQYLPPKPRQTYIPPRPIVAPITRPSNDYLPPVTVPKPTYIPPVPKNTYIPPVIKHEPVVAPRNTYIPPAPVAPKNTYIPPPSAPMNTYLPPGEQYAPKKHIITPSAPRIEDLVAPQPPQSHYEESEIFTDNGYKTVRKHKL